MPPSVPTRGFREESLSTKRSLGIQILTRSYEVHVCPVQPVATEAAFAFAGAPQRPVQPDVKGECFPFKSMKFHRKLLLLLYRCFIPRHIQGQTWPNCRSNMYINLNSCPTNMGNEVFTVFTAEPGLRFLHWQGGTAFRDFLST